MMIAWTVASSPGADIVSRGSTCGADDDQRQRRTSCWSFDQTLLSAALTCCTAPAAADLSVLNAHLDCAKRKTSESLVQCICTKRDGVRVSKIRGRFYLLV